MTISNVWKIFLNWCGRPVTPVFVLFLSLANACLFGNEFQNIAPKPTSDAELILDVKALGDQQRCVQVIWVSAIAMPEHHPEFLPDENISADSDLQCASLWSMDTQKNVRYFLIPGALYEPLNVSQQWQLGGDFFTTSAHWPGVRIINSKQLFTVGGSQQSGGYHVIRLGDR